MCVFIFHGKKIQNLRYIKVNNTCIHLPQQKGSGPKIYKRK